MRGWDGPHTVPARVRTASPSSPRIQGFSCATLSFPGAQAAVPAACPTRDLAQVANAESIRREEPGCVYVCNKSKQVPAISLIKCPRPRCRPPATSPSRAPPACNQLPAPQARLRPRRDGWPSGQGSESSSRGLRPPGRWKVCFCSFPGSIFGASLLKEWGPSWGVHRGSESPDPKTDPSQGQATSPRRSHLVDLTPEI